MYTDINSNLSWMLPAALQVFDSKLRQGQVMIDMGQDPTKQLMAAHAVSPHRAEPLYHLALYHASASKACNQSDAMCSIKHNLRAIVCANYSSTMPLPENDILFVNSQVYETGALQALTAQVQPIIAGHLTPACVVMSCFWLLLDFDLEQLVTAISCLTALHQDVPCYCKEALLHAGVAVGERVARCL